MVETDNKTLTPHVLTPEEQRQRSRRNRALALALGLFVVLIFAVTILRLGASVADRPF